MKILIILLLSLSAFATEDKGLFAKKKADFLEKMKAMITRDRRI